MAMILRDELASRGVTFKLSDCREIVRRLLERLTEIELDLAIRELGSRKADE